MNGTRLTFRALGLLLCCGTGAAGSHSSLQAQLPSWTLERNLQIGEMDGPRALSRVADVVVDSGTGRIYIAQPTEQAIKVFDPAGRLVHAFGRRGAGPGEFQGGLGHLGFTGDSLYAVDAANQRISMFSLAGSVHYSTRLVSPPPEARMGVPGPIGMLADGRILAKPMLSRQASLDTSFSVPLALYERDGALRGVLTRLKEGGTQGHLRTERGAVVFWQPLAAPPLVAVEQHGRSVVVVTRDPRAQRDGRPVFRVQTFTAAGEVLYDRYYNYRPEPLPPTVTDSLRQSWISDFGSRLLSASAAVRASRELLTFPPHEPPISAVATSTSGDVWLRREEIGKTLVEYIVLNAVGTPVARVQLPRGVIVRRIVGDEVYAVTHGEFDIPYVVRYQIRRS
ncbi:MAG TPA: hypothetical protein VK929_17230 [Longimicrobiales bacterium]|nr:hypothetical protein [Longimicrobiales bacterium]